MFTQENTEGFTGSDLVLMNEALAVLIAYGLDEKTAGDRVNNNWQPTGNTVESLTDDAQERADREDYERRLYEAESAHYRRLEGEEREREQLLGNP